jgi:tetratricopeptide (TPR) repeat protein
MSDIAGKWTWILDGDPVQTEIDLERDVAEPAGRPASDPSVVIALHLHLHGSSQEALRELEGAALTDSDAMLLAGQILFEMKRFEEAADYFKRLADTVRDHPLACFNHGIALARLKKWRAAAESLRRGVNINPDQAKAWFALGVCLVQDKQAAEGHSCFSQCLDLRPDYVPAWFGQAASLQIQGKHRDALEIYERLLAAEPNAEELLNNALLAALEIADAGKTAAFASRLLLIRPEHPAALFAMFQIAAGLDDFREAAQWCTRLAGVLPASAAERHNLGVCYQRLGEHGKAAEAFEAALQLRWNDVDAIEGLAASLTEIQEIGKARETWRRLLRLAPDREQAWFRLGLLHYDTGEHAEATAAFQECVRRKPAWADAWANLGACRWISGHRKQAVEAFESAMRLDPGNRTIRKSLASLAIELEDALMANRYVGGLAPEDWDVCYNLAVLEQSRGKLDEAARLYRSVTESAPEFAPAWLNLGNVLFSLGDAESSRVCWRSAIEKDPALAAQFVTR